MLRFRSRIRCGGPSVRNGGASFDPAQFFAAGEAGFYGAVSAATVWQDTARTNPVTATGQSVASWLLNTASGVIYATQNTALLQPTYEIDAAGLPYLLFPAAGLASLVTPTIDFTGTDKVTVIAGVRKASDAARGSVLELGTGASASFRLEAPPGVSATYAFGSTGSNVVLATTAANFAAPDTAVLTGLGDIANDVAILRRNSAQVASNSSDQGTGAYGNAAVFIGRRGGTSLPFNGRIYALIVRGAATSGGALISAERWVNTRTGAF